MSNGRKHAEIGATARNNRMPHKRNGKTIHHPGYTAPSRKPKKNRVDPATGGRTHKPMSAAETKVFVKKIPKFSRTRRPATVEE